MPAPNGDYIMQPENDPNQDPNQVSISGNNYVTYDNTGTVTGGGTIGGGGNTFNLGGDYVIQRQDGVWNWSEPGGGDSAHGKMYKRRSPIDTGNQQT